MDIADILFTRLRELGVSERDAARRAARMARQGRFFTKAVGVTFGNRQAVLNRLAWYPEGLVRLTLVREPHNPADRYAVAVWARIARQSHKLGYLPAGTAAVFSALLDAGVEVGVHYRVTGGRGMHYGLNLELEIPGCRLVDASGQ